MVANCDHLARLKFSPGPLYACTEHGALMLASHKVLAHKLNELERRISGHDSDIQAVVKAIRQLMELPKPPPRRRLGFGVEEPKVRYVVTE